jgi:hypothetical protein
VPEFKFQQPIPLSKKPKARHDADCADVTRIKDKRQSLLGIKRTNAFYFSGIRVTSAKPASCLFVLPHPITRFPHGLVNFHQNLMPQPRSKADAILMEREQNTMAVIAPLVGWLIPGAGHLIQRRWIRGALLMLSVVAMFVLGVMMEGKVYGLNGGDLLDMLGFVGDLGGGLLYFVTRMMDWGKGAIQLASADYGTKFIIVAGLLNVISAVDAHDIAIGKKE